MYEIKSKPSKMRFQLQQLLRHILMSLVPRMQRSSVDLIGPLLAISVLIGLLHYGNAYKLPSAAHTISPLIAVFVYTTVMPLLAYILVHLGQGTISFLETASLIGYGLYGHVFTLLTSLFLGSNKSDSVFFVCLVIVGGLSALRVALVLLMVIPRPGARLIVCSSVATLQLLSLVLMHFVYMHRTFKYGHGA